ncbi:MAG: hypothetical protein GY862_39445 [Gammaproteobacteria bacterium]|nr:hypothetical protein [Gammaproteobacteria bacterium]
MIMILKYSGVNSAIKITITSTSTIKSTIKSTSTIKGGPDISSGLY